MRLRKELCFLVQFFFSLIIGVEALLLHWSAFHLCWKKFLTSWITQKKKDETAA